MTSIGERVPIATLFEFMMSMRIHLMVKDVFWLSWIVVVVVFVVVVVGGGGVVIVSNDCVI